MKHTSKPSEEASGIQIPGSAWIAAARITMAATLWLVRRPFLMSRARWALLLAIAVGADAITWLVAPTSIAIALALLPLVIIGVLAHWRWLGRGTQPIIFISLFEGRSALGRDAAWTHIGALARFLIEDENLAQIGPFCGSSNSDPAEREAGRAPASNIRCAGGGPWLRRRRW